MVAFLILAVVEEARLLGDAAAIEPGMVARADLVTTSEPDPQAPPPEFAPAGFDAFREVLDRPIFSATRRPPSVVISVIAETAPPSASEPTLHLHGIVTTGSEAMALIAMDSAPDLYRVAIGDEIARWRIEEIGDEGVLLRQGDRSMRLQLDYAGFRQ
jgi:hypothetical protein